MASLLPYLDATSGASARQIRWLGTMWAVLSNQNPEMRFRTFPLLGIPVGRTTSKAEMRSVAIINSVSSSTE